MTVRHCSACTISSPDKFEVTRYLIARVHSAGLDTLDSFFCLFYVCLGRVCECVCVCVCVYLCCPSFPLLRRETIARVIDVRSHAATTIMHPLPPAVASGGAVITPHAAQIVLAPGTLPDSAAWSWKLPILVLF